MTDDPHNPIPIDVPDQDNKVQIDKDYFEAPTALMTGRELLELAGKKPAENFAIYRKIKGGSARAHWPRREDRPEPPGRGALPDPSARPDRGTRGAPRVRPSRG